MVNDLPRLWDHPTSQCFSSPMVEALVLETSQCRFESYEEHSSSTRLVVWTLGSHPRGEGSIPSWSTKSHRLGRW